VWPGGIIVSSFHEILLPNPRNMSRILQNPIKEWYIPAAPIMKSAICKVGGKERNNKMIKKIYR
jgi:hypothetical protein